MYGLETIKAMNRKGARNATPKRTLTLTRPEALVLSEALAVYRPDNAQDEDTRLSLIVKLGRV